MLGLSVGKVLFTAIVVMVVLYGWKWLNRVQERQKEASRRVREASRRQSRRNQPVEAVDMTQCPTCGDYVQAKGAKSCGRPDCPYPG